MSTQILNQKHPRISVIIPLYNKETTIGSTLQSILSQSSPPFEVIVVDDGSTDNGPEIVTKFDNILVGLKLIRQKNQGVSAARNRGIRETQGSHIAFLDADDTWESDHVISLISMIEQFPDASLYGTAYRKIFPSHKSMSIVIKSFENNSGIIFSYFQTICNAQFIYTSSIMIPKEVIAAIGGFPTGVRNAEDLDLWVRASLHGAVAYCGKVTVNYSCGQAGQATGKHAAQKGYDPYYLQTLHQHARNESISNRDTLDLIRYIKIYEKRICIKYACAKPININSLNNYFDCIKERAVSPPAILRFIRFFPFYFIWNLYALPAKLFNSIWYLEHIRNIRFLGNVKFTFQK